MSTSKPSSIAYRLAFSTLSKKRHSLNQLELLKRPDTTKRNNSGAIEDDDYMLLVLKYYWLSREGGDFYLSELFKLFDSQNMGIMDTEFFKMLGSIIEPFNQNINISSFSLTKEDFIKISKKENMFAEKKITKFIGTIDDYCQYARQLSISVDYINNTFLERALLKKNNYVPPILDIFKERLLFLKDPIYCKSRLITRYLPYV
jgi:hypothetical protein